MLFNRQLFINCVHPKIFLFFTFIDYHKNTLYAISDFKKNMKNTLH